MKNFISKFTRLPKSAKITALTSGFVALTLVFAGLGFALLGDSASNVAHTEHNVLTSLGTEILTESEVEAAVLDPIVEREIFDGVDTGLTGDIDELELVNVIYVKNTLADGIMYQIITALVMLWAQETLKGSLKCSSHSLILCFLYIKSMSLVTTILPSLTVFSMMNATRSNMQTLHIGTSQVML